MRLRTDLLTTFLDDIIDYETDESDFQFYLNTPKITFLEDGNLDIGDESDDEEGKNIYIYF